MATRYHTSIDCCERMVAELNYSEMNKKEPQVSDKVVIKSGHSKHIEMEVAYRTWDLDGDLNIELVRTGLWKLQTLTEFENFVKGLKP